ncbi:MAG: ABC transporter permease [Pseudomonadota bacterium]
MFATNRSASLPAALLSFVELLYHSTVRAQRRGHGNAVIGMITSIMQTVVMVGVFYVMFEFMGLRGMAIRGDFFVYLFSGVFLFFTHIKTLGAVAGAEGPTSPMMLHAPMTTMIAILSAALSTLYTQFLALFAIMTFYHLLIAPVEIDRPAGAFAMIFLAWYSGIAIGMVFLALKPWYPGFTRTTQMLYTRINLIASGKLTVGNMLPFQILPLFLWNPLFHIIDQARGYAFVNYFPHHTNITYPLLVSTVFLVVGFVGESYTRKHASLSWAAKR